MVFLFLSVHYIMDSILVPSGHISCAQILTFVCSCIIFNLDKGLL